MQKTYQRSFAGGEIAPLMFGRLDLAKFQTGLAKCLNFMVTPQGPVENRAGFEYVQKVKTPGAVLIPFTYNAEQSFSLEFGDQYVRFHTNGSTLLEAAKTITAITQAAPGVFEIAAHGYADGDWLYLGSVGGMTALTGRWGIVAAATTNTFSLTDLFGDLIDTSAMPAYSSGGTASRVYEIDTPYLAADLFDLHYVQSADVLTIVHQDYQVGELRRLGATNWALTTVSFVPSIATPAMPTAGTGGPGGGAPIAHNYLTTAIADGTLEESLKSLAVTVSCDLTVVGNYIEITPALVAGAVRYNVYKLASGGIYGYAGQTDGTAFRDVNVTPDTSITPPLAFDPFSGENPRAVSYSGQRRVFGGGGTKPQNIQMTRPGTESNMTYSIPTQDNDAIIMRIVAREAHIVRHLVPLGDLLALTSGGAWKIAGAQGVLTPAGVSAEIQSYVGASNVQPVTTSESVLYAPARGSHIREISYKWESQRYFAADIAVLAPHLFDYKSVLQLAYSSTPNQTLWVVRNDGILLGLTHQPEHEIKAWHQHDTQGLFKSVCAVSEGDEDGVYAIIERTIGARTVQYIERQHTRQFATLADAFFVDCGLTYRGAARGTITGLWHLEGKSVVALADGGVEPAQVVTGGAISLSAPASVVHVGLSYNADFQTVPVSLEASAALGQGLNKNINGWAMRVYRSSGVKSGPTFDKLLDYPQRTQADPYGAPPGMVTDVITMKMSPLWQENGAICVRQAAPLPLTILSLAPEVATGGA